MKKVLCITLLTLVISACSAGQNTGTIPTATTSDDVRVASLSNDSTTSVLKLLTKQVAIGSSIDPINGDKSPGGLIVVPKTASHLTKGDLLACNSENKAGTAGQGTTVVEIAAKAGSKPSRFAQSSDLLGCSNIALAWQQELVYAMAPTAKSAVPIAASGTVDTSGIVKSGLTEPFGTTYGSSAPETGTPPPYSSDALWVADVATGSMATVYWGPSGGGQEIKETITGLPVSHSAAGALGPVSLMFDLSGGTTTIYALDSANSTLYAFGSACGKDVAPALNLVEPKDVVVGPTGKTFSGHDAKSGCIIHSGAPLATPVAGTMLYNGNFVIANAGQKGANTIVELSPTGATLDTRTVDTGNAGAIGGLAASGTTAANTELFFTDKNENNIQELLK
jgi:hypothetical protein